MRLPTPRGHVATAHGVRALAYFEYANFKHAVIGYLQWTMAGGRPAVWDVFHGLGTGPHAAFTNWHTCRGTETDAAFYIDSGLAHMLRLTLVDVIAL